MPLSQLRADFDQLKKGRKTDPQAALSAVGAFSADAVEVLEEHTQLHEFAWRGMGDKQYLVAALPGSDLQFSRALNSELLIASSAEFREGWATFQKAVLQSKESGRLQGIDPPFVDRVAYSAVVGYAAVVDLFNPGDRGGPGTLFEMLVGPVISSLTGRPEGGAIEIPLEETGETERILTDLSFEGEVGQPVLVVPTKISTRERISQAYVHQRILDAVHARGGSEYRSVLAVANENNTMFRAKTPKRSRTIKNGWTQETLVPNAIVLYHKYVAKLSGMYYLDPPLKYLEQAPTAFPAVAPLSKLLVNDLPRLVSSKSDCGTVGAP